MLRAVKIGYGAGNGNRDRNLSFELIRDRSVGELHKRQNVAHPLEFASIFSRKVIEQLGIFLIARENRDNVNGRLERADLIWAG